MWVQPAMFDHLSLNSTFYLKFQISANLLSVYFIYIMAF